MLINPQTEKYCPEWFIYLKRSTSHDKLKPRPNDRIDINVYEKCFVGEARGGAEYKKTCQACYEHSSLLMQGYWKLMQIGNIEQLNISLDWFFNHLKSKHGKEV